MVHYILQPHHIFVHVKAFVFMLVQSGLQFLIISMCYAWCPVASISKSHVLTAHACVNCRINAWLSLLTYLLTGDRCQARHFYVAKQFCFLDADCLVVGESQGSSRLSVGKYPVKPQCPEGDSQTTGTYRCRNH